MGEATDLDPKRVVIVGGGFAGLTAAKALGRAPVRLTVVDRCNHHLFQPLLYQVATAGLSPADIAAPIRHVVGRQRNTEVLLGEVVGVDLAAREVILARERVPYDLLILATGATHAYPKPEWATVAPGLKPVEDATAIRAKVLLAFEKAEAAADEAERRRLLNFVVVGGGPTGVELAGAIAELSRRVLTREFRHIDPATARIVLLEGAPRILTALPEALSDYARRALTRLGVEVRTGTFADAIDADGVTIRDPRGGHEGGHGGGHGGSHEGGHERIESRTVLWAAGVKASPAARWLGVEADRAGRVAVEPDLSVPGHPEIFVVGDTAAVAGPDGAPVPGIAPAAKQMGRHAAEEIKSRLYSAPPPGPFRYRHAGNLATIGRSAAVIDFGWWRVRGRLAWLLWGLAHVWFLIGFRSKVMVMAEWIWAYLTFKKGMRLITGPVE